MQYIQLHTAIYSTYNYMQLHIVHTATYSGPEASHHETARSDCGAHLMFNAFWKVSYVCSRFTCPFLHTLHMVHMQPTLHMAWSNALPVVQRLHSRSDCGAHLMFNTFWYVSHVCSRFACSFPTYTTYGAYATYATYDMHRWASVQLFTFDTYRTYTVFDTYCTYCHRIFRHSTQHVDLTLCRYY
jgi:hypothetical protein